MPNQNFTGLKILVLDDNFGIRTLAGRWFKAHGAVLTLCATNDEVLGQIDEAKGKKPWNAAVVDWNLEPDGKIGGPYTEPSIRALIGLNIPTLVTSATDDETGLLKGLSEEFKDKAFGVVWKDPSFEVRFEGFPPRMRS